MLYPLSLLVWPRRAIGQPTALCLLAPALVASSYRPLAIGILNGFFSPQLKLHIVASPRWFLDAFPVVVINVSPVSFINRIPLLP